MLLQLFVKSIALGAIYGMIAMGFSLLWQTSRTINFAQGEFVTVPAFLMVLFWHLFKLPFVLALIGTTVVSILILGFLIGVGIHLLFQTPGLITQWLMPTSTMGQTIQQILNVVATSLAAVFTAIAMILYYYDIRLRSEGFDLKMMAEHL